MTTRCKSITEKELYYAKRLRQRREALGLSLRAVNKATGIPLSMLWYYEIGCTRVNQERRAVLESYYRVLEIERHVGLPKLDEQAREVIGSIIDQLTELLRTAD